MNDCCASSSSRNEAVIPTPDTLPSYAVRPGVTFPDWSTVTSPAVRDALLAMVGSGHVLNRWSGYDPATDRVRVALLQLYVEHGRALTVAAIANLAGLGEAAVPPLLDELRRRDLVVLDGERIVGAYPFTDQDRGHEVTLDGRALNAMCAVDALGIGAMTDRDISIASSCRHCGAPIRITTRDRGRVLADVEPGTAFIGIDYALRAGGEATQRFAICCSQVFDAEGSGLEFVAYEAEGVHMFGKNPYLRRDQMLKVMARSLAIYQRKHSGDPPRRIVVHKNTEFRADEIEGVFDALPNADSIELVHVQQSCGWRGVLIAGPQRPHGYPCQRGSTFQLGPHEALLWTQGNLPAVAKGKDYYKEGKGTPEPLLLVRQWTSRCDLSIPISSHGFLKSLTTSFASYSIVRCRMRRR